MSNTPSDANDESQAYREAVGPEPATRPTEDMAQSPETVTAQTDPSARVAAETMAAPVMRAPESSNIGQPAPGLGHGTAPIGSASPNQYRDRDRGPRTGGYRREGPGGGRGERGERGAFGRRKVCGFCMDNIQYIDYKDTARLRRFLSERGKIEPRRKTGTCTKHQRWLTTALKRARQLALLPYTADHVRFMGR